MPRDTHPKVTVVSEEKAVVASDPGAPAGKYKLMAFYLVNGKYYLYQVSNPKNVVAVAPADVEFTVGEQELSANVLGKESSKRVFLPDSVSNTLASVRKYVLPS